MSSDINDLSQRLEALENHLAHQELAFEELSNHLYQQQQLIDKLENQVRIVVNRLKDWNGDSGKLPTNERPPHY
jgi:SlyX protein